MQPGSSVQIQYILLHVTFLYEEGIAFYIRYIDKKQDTCGVKVNPHYGNPFHQEAHHAPYFKFFS